MEYSRYEAQALFEENEVVGRVVFRQLGLTGVVSVLMEIASKSAHSDLSFGIYPQFSSHPGDEDEEGDGADECPISAGYFDSRPLPLPANPCELGSFTNCATGDLSGKFGPLEAFPKTKVYREFQTDPSLSLHGASSIMGRSLVVFAGTKILACTNIISPTLVAKFFVGPLEGRVVFQDLQDQVSYLFFSTFEEMETKTKLKQ